MNARLLVTGSVYTQPPPFGLFRIDFRLWDVTAGKQVAGFGEDACRAFNRLDRDFPQMTSTVKDRETAERLPLHC